MSKLWILSILNFRFLLVKTLSFCEVPFGYWTNCEKSTRPSRHCQNGLSWKKTNLNVPRSERRSYTLPIQDCSATFWVSIRQKNSSWANTEAPSSKLSLSRNWQRNAPIKAKARTSHSFGIQAVLKWISSPTGNIPFPSKSKVQSKRNASCPPEQENTSLCAGTRISRARSFISETWHAKLTGSSMLAGKTGERENNWRKPVEHRSAFDFKTVL